MEMFIDRHTYAGSMQTRLLALSAERVEKQCHPKSNEFCFLKIGVMGR